MGRPSRFSRLADGELASRYWAAREELERLRAAPQSWAAAPSGEEMAGAFQRIRELDELCEQLWRESQRRASAGSIGNA